jgi:hypothetical protein
MTKYKLIIETKTRTVEFLFDNKKSAIDFASKYIKANQLDDYKMKVREVCEKS